MRRRTVEFPPFRMRIASEAVPQLNAKRGSGPGYLPAPMSMLSLVFVVVDCAVSDDHRFPTRKSLDIITSSSAGHKMASPSPWVRVSHRNDPLNSSNTIAMDQSLPTHPQGQQPQPPPAHIILHPLPQHAQPLKQLQSNLNFMVRSLEPLNSGTNGTSSFDAQLTMNHRWWKLAKLCALPCYGEIQPVRWTRTRGELPWRRTRKSYDSCWQAQYPCSMMPWMRWRLRL